MLGRSTEIWIGAAALALSAAAFFFWIPFDTETPPIYTFRRQTFIGDAMLPAVASGGIAVFAAIHLVMALLRRDATDGGGAPFDALTLVFFALFSGIIAAALTVMFWAGPAALALFGPGGDDAVGYRQMRSTFPWKHLGFALGGFILVFGVISLLEGGVQWRRAVVAALAVLGLILVFDAPFDTLLLPPNGDF